MAATILRLGYCSTSKHRYPNVRKWPYAAGFGRRSACQIAAVDKSPYDPSESSGRAGSLLNHFVGAHHYRLRNCEAKRFGRFQIDC